MRICLQQFRILFFLSHIAIFVDVLAVDEVLLLTSPSHPIQVTHLLYREIMRFQLVSHLIIDVLLRRFFILGYRWLKSRFLLALPDMFCAEGRVHPVVAVQFEAGLDGFVVATDSRNGLLDLR